tara:strand:+ start:85 stop:756 length:672 start_codon:yes stop_codon:yes gene_type:complete
MFAGANGYFNNQALKKLVVAFGNLFNDIRVTKPPDNDQYKVPLTYSPKEKFIRRIQEPSTISDITRTRITLPRMGFEMVGLNYDPTRKRNKLTKTNGTIFNDTTGASTSVAFAEVPYLVNFGLYTFCRTIEENLQIVEQISAYFTPEFIININMTPSNKDVAVPILLTSVGMSELYEGGFEDTRTVTTTFSFIAKSYIYGPESIQGVVSNPQINPQNDFFTDF